MLVFLLFLSGGLDSTSIIKQAAKYLPTLNTFSVGFLEKEYDESQWAKLASEKFKIPNETK